MESKELPYDLICEILLKIPIKSMMRFKTVSKNWLKLISRKSNPFAFRPRRRTTSFLVLRREPDNNSNIFPISVRRGRIRKLLPQIHLQKQLAETTGQFVLFPAGYGILCLSKSICENPETVTLWNPTTNQTKVLPPSPYYSSFYQYRHFATVVECKDGTFSYKVGRVTSKTTKYLEWSQQRREYSLSLELYSSKTNSWKIIPNFFTGELCGNSNPIFHCANLNGKAHWVIQLPEEDTYITAFDYETELFTRIKAPRGCYDKRRWLVTLLDDKFLCLGLSTQISDDDRHSYLDIWVLRNYEDEDSWVKEFSVGPLHQYIEVLGFSSKVQAVFLRDPQIDPGYLLSCDCKSSKITEYIPIGNRPEKHMEVVEHFSSHVSLPNQ